MAAFEARKAAKDLYLARVKAKAKLIPAKTAEVRWRRTLATDK